MHQARLLPWFLRVVCGNKLSWEPTLMQNQLQTHFKAVVSMYMVVDRGSTGLSMAHTHRERYSLPQIADKIQTQQALSGRGN